MDPIEGNRNCTSEPISRLNQCLTAASQAEGPGHCQRDQSVGSSSVSVSVASISSTRFTGLKLACPAEIEVSKNMSIV